MLKSRWIRLSEGCALAPGGRKGSNSTSTSPVTTFKKLTLRNCMGGFLRAGTYARGDGDGDDDDGDDDDEDDDDDVKE